MVQEFCGHYLIVIPIKAPWCRSNNNDNSYNVDNDDNKKLAADLSGS